MSISVRDGGKDWRVVELGRCSVVHQLRSAISAALLESLQRDVDVGGAPFDDPEMTSPLVRCCVRRFWCC
jgi:hypothetical protein